MKHLILAGLMTAVLGGPAWANSAHQVQVAHEGGTLEVSYRPIIDTSFRQTGIGPRNVTRCFWKSDVAVERTVAVAPGHAPVAALTRVRNVDSALNGVRVGSCGRAAERQAAAQGGDMAKLRGVLVQEAERDRPEVLADLASIGKLRLAGTE